jgi:hypothetical protein
MMHHAGSASAGSFGVKRRLQDMVDAYPHPCMLVNCTFSIAAAAAVISQMHQQVSSATGMSVGGLVRINIDDPAAFLTHSCCLLHCYRQII